MTCKTKRANLRGRLFHIALFLCLMKCTEIVLTSTEAIDLSEVEAVTGDIKSYTGMEPVQRPIFLYWMSSPSSNR